MYGNLTGVWFSKRAERTSPRGRTFVRSFVRSSCTWGCARHTRREGGGVMTMMAILKHNILWDDVGVVQKLYGDGR